MRKKGKLGSEKEKEEKEKKVMVREGKGGERKKS